MYEEYDMICRFMAETERRLGRTFSDICAVAKCSDGPASRQKPSNRN